MPEQRHTFGNTDLRYGVKLGPAMLTGERVKTARQNREINQFQLESAREEKARAEASRQMWVEADTPEKAAEALRRDPVYGKQVIEAQKAQSDEQRAQTRRRFGAISQRLDAILRQPPGQRAQAWEAAWQSLPPKIQEKIPREYNEKQVLAWARQSAAAAQSFDAYQKNKDAIAIENLKQKNRVALQKAKKALEAPGQTNQQMITNIGKHVDILFGEKANVWEAVSAEVAGGQDKKKHIALRIKAMALDIRREGETNPFRAIQMAAKEILGIDLEAEDAVKANEAIKANEENMKNTFLGAATAPASAPASAP